MKIKRIPIQLDRTPIQLDREPIWIHFRRPIKTQITRKPIEFYGRRNHRFNPEFLDINNLFIKFSPLMKSVYRYFEHYQGLFENPSDREELYGVIQREFVELYRAFNPRRGVDFTGYMSFQLRQRVYHWVTTHQKQQQNELLMFAPTEFPNDFPDIEVLMPVEQKEAYDDTELFDAMMSAPWKNLSNAEASLLEDIVFKHNTLQDLVKPHRSSVTQLTNRVNKLADKLIGLNRKKEHQIVSKSTSQTKVVNLESDLYVEDCGDDECYG